MSQEQEQKYCCHFFKSCIKNGQIVTKDVAFPDLKQDKDFFTNHPKYLIWIDSKDPMSKGYLWFHFCSNCGYKHSTDEQITHWNKIFDI